MIILKEYQQHSLDWLRLYFKTCQQLGNADTAYYETTRQAFGSGIPYRDVKALPGLPYVCLRMPTGGGKTLVASHSIGVAANELLHAGNPVILWLVPSNAIKEQTLQALKALNHPYHKAIEESFSSLSVLSILEALFVTRSTLATGATIIVSTMQAFRVDDTEGRKVYEPSGALMDHFNGIDPVLLSSLDKYEDGKPIQSLANLLRLHRPIVIVDEAHNARTALSFETLARFNPSCILEFTATPDTKDNPSNVLCSVSAAELKADQMIKIPIRLETRPNWKELLNDAIALRKSLEAIAIAERLATGEYIRPIMLIQAQPKSQNQETLTVEVVEKCLMEDFFIPEEQICRATGTDRGLEGVDLNDTTCPIRFIITVQALKEGWDCPFAYVLCSVAEMHSSTAVEQILGRIMRLPKAMLKQNEALNRSYAFAASANFISAANALEDALVQNGFNRQEAKDLIVKAPSSIAGVLETMWTQFSIPVNEVPQLNTLPEFMASRVEYDAGKKELVVYGLIDEPMKKALKNCFETPEGKASIIHICSEAVMPKYNADRSPAERGEPFSIPTLAIKQGTLYEAFEKTHFLEKPWELSKCDYRLTESEYSPKLFDGQIVEIDVSEKGDFAKRFIYDLNKQMTFLYTDQKETVSNLVHWLDRTIPHTDIPPSESGPFLVALVHFMINDRKFTIDQLCHDKYTLRQKVSAKIEAHRKEANTRAYQTLLLSECETPIIVSPEVCFSFVPSVYPYRFPYRGSYKFQKHYYKEVGNLDAKGEEFECAVYIDTLPEVKFWVRNLEQRERHSFWLQTSTDRFYPDFVCMLNNGRFLVIEYKGENIWSSADSQEKLALGELWEKRSNGLCLFVMPKGKDFESIKAKMKI